MSEIFEFLDEFDKVEPTIALARIKNTFNLSFKEAQKIYRNWRKQYLKPKIKVSALRYKKV